MQPRVVIIGGPTASGKTSLAIAIARKLNTDIISFDSRQLYKQLNIGVARPSPEELSTVRHHFIAEADISEPWTAARFAEEAAIRLQDIVQQKGSAVLCGGTGLYLRSLIHGLDHFPLTDTQLREDLNHTLQSSGIDALRRRLLHLDPLAAENIDTSNPARVIRAIEILEANPGLPLASLRKGESREFPYPCNYYGLNWPRETLYERINRRVDAMITAGLLQEAESLSAFKHFSVMKTVGYTEIFDFLDGKTSWETAVELIKQHTRNYAKRQLTWFRNQTPMKWLLPETAEAIITEDLRGFKIL